MLQKLGDWLMAKFAWRWLEDRDGWEVEVNTVTGEHRHRRAYGSIWDDHDACWILGTPPYKPRDLDEQDPAEMARKLAKPMIVGMDFGKEPPVTAVASVAFTAGHPTVLRTAYLSELKGGGHIVSKRPLTPLARDSIVFAGSLDECLEALAREFYPERRAKS